MEKLRHAMRKIARHDHGHIVSVWMSAAEIEDAKQTLRAWAIDKGGDPNTIEFFEEETFGKTCGVGVQADPLST